jgi:hypothetical protein
MEITMKKTLTYAGILVSFVFLLVLNTNVLSYKSCDATQCPGTGFIYFHYCYADESQDIDATCEIIKWNVRRCYRTVEVLTCSKEWTYICCIEDEQNCRVINYEPEGDETTIGDNEPPK